MDEGSAADRSGRLRGGRDLAGRTGLVTGATSGVGRAISRALAGAGAEVWGVGRDRDALDELEAETRDTPGETHAVRADLSRDDRVRGLAATVRENNDGLDYLIHSAGVFIRDEVENFDPDDFERLFGLHVRARSLLTRDLLPSLRDASGHVLFVNSSLGLRSSPGAGMYSGSMHALRAVADALRDEVNEDDVRVTSLFLGRTATPMQEEIHRNEGRPYEADRLIQPETVARTTLQALTVPRDAEITNLQLRPMQKPPPRRQDDGD